MEQRSIEPEIQAYFQSMQAMDQLYEEYAHKHGLTFMSLYILETIYTQKGCTQKQISQITMYPKQTVNMVVRSFLQRGWVLLEQDGDDRRSKCVRLTEEGQAFAIEVIEALWNAGRRAFSELTAEERNIMLRAVDAFSKSFVEKVRKM